jgi:acetyl-CoA C-acetyltransferase
MTNAYVLDAVRTPRGRGKAQKGALSGIHPQELFAQLLPALEKRNGFDPHEVDDVILGAVAQVGEQGANIARNAVLTSGWPIEVSGVSLNRFCGSGLQAVNFASMAVSSGQSDLIVAGGVESMSRLPIGADGAGQDGGNLHLRERVFQIPQGISADLIASIEHISRAQVDGYALSSQRLAATAIDQNRFARSIVPTRDPVSGAVVLTRDESPRPSTTLEGLHALEPSFAALGATVVGPHGETFDQIALAAHPEAGRIEHVHTAGNSSGLADGAGAVLVASAAYVLAHGVTPRARILSTATVGSDPVLMLTGPAPASLKALAKVGLRPRDVDVWEINEAFAAVVLQTVRKLDIDPDRVNPNGGAIALGHPLGATGAMLLGTAIDELERTGGRIGVITMCIGGGQGIATVIERV